MEAQTVLYTVGNDFMFETYCDDTDVPREIRQRLRQEVERTARLLRALDGKCRQTIIFHEDD